MLKQKKHRPVQGEWIWEDIIIDNRESKTFLNELRNELNFIISSNPKLDHFRIISRRLPVGDLVYKNLVAEHKEIHDMFNSIKDGRMFKQPYDMYTNYKYVYLLINGSPYHLQNNAQAKSIYTTLADLELRYNLRARFCFSEEMVAHYFIMLCYKLKKNLQPVAEIVRTGVKKTNEQVSTLSGISGVAKKNAVSLLENFKTIKALANASVEDISKVIGFGKKRALHIFNVFNNEYVSEKELCPTPENNKCPYLLIGEFGLKCKENLDKKFKCIYGKEGRKEIDNQQRQIE